MRRCILGPRLASSIARQFRLRFPEKQRHSTRLDRGGRDPSAQPCTASLRGCSLHCAALWDVGRADGRRPALFALLSLQREPTCGPGITPLIGHLPSRVSKRGKVGGGTDFISVGPPLQLICNVRGLWRASDDSGESRPESHPDARERLPAT
ncbi:hypothetical protein VUR80DRAFT_5281 [Thermomyces stellatus]